MEKEKDGLKAGLMDSLTRVETSPHCCCFYVFCCCFCYSDQKLYSKSFYIEKWKNYLVNHYLNKANEQSSKKQFNDPFRILTNLWANKNVINDLESIRLNPNIMMPDPIRNDLEFYIPQLCTFLIFGDYQVVEEFLVFLCKACYASFFFAHRIIWFLKSNLDVNSEYNHKVLDILILLQNIFKSEREKNELESLYIANNNKFIESLKNNRMIGVYNDTSNLNSSIDIEQILENKQIGKNLISEYSDNLFDFVMKKDDRKEFIWEKKIAFENIFVNVFKKQDFNMVANNSLHFEDFEQIDPKDINLTSFLSNVNFIDKLSNICELVRIAPSENQLTILQQELNIINKVLPCNIYIPFLSEKIRNYIIVHIPVSETRIFKTKTRAPYMLTVEVIRIDELIYYLNSIKKKRSNDNLCDTIRSHTIQNSPKKLNMMNMMKNLYEKEKSQIDLKTHLEFLHEQDINLSRPVMIKNISKVFKTTKLLENYKVSQEEDEDYKKIEKFVKTRLTISYKNQNNLLDSNNYSENSDEILRKDFSINNDGSSSISIDINYKDEKFGKNEVIKNKLNDEDNKTNDIKEVNDIFTSQIFYDGQNKNASIFGEKFEEQSERLKKVSPFGNCSSWKIFKIIIKSGDDLRQEQFATQLINEFDQIFHLENVDMWLKPYEILSTGQNVGIIECVPNAISIDYLKRNSKNFSTLSQYFENHYGSPTQKNYKTAIMNFIRSLAAYSLVCYFLQIKDRHNGNILIDDKGHIIHIDFGFMLSNAPGKGIQFEKAPFKLTNEFVDVIGGVNSKNFSKFKKLLCKGFIAASKHHEKIIMLVEMMYCGHGKNMPCFVRGQETIEELRQRFNPRKNMKNHDYISHVNNLIGSSIDNWRTKWYDKYQYWFQGIVY